MWTRAELKSNAIAVFKQNYWPAVGAFFISGVIMGVPAAAGSMIMNLMSLGGTGGAVAGWIIYEVLYFAAYFFLGLPVSVGLIRFYLNCRRGTAQISDLFFAFRENYMNVVKVMFFWFLYIWLWSLLFIIPGIIKGLEYFMVPYYLAENSSADKDWCFAQTKAVMNGQKADTFVLSLSFIGWALLAPFTCYLLLPFWLMPYMCLTFAELYWRLSGQTGSNPYGGYGAPQGPSGYGTPSGYGAPTGYADPYAAPQAYADPYAPAAPTPAAPQGMQTYTPPVDPAPQGMQTYTPPVAPAAPVYEAPAAPAFDAAPVPEAPAAPAFDAAPVPEAPAAPAFDATPVPEAPAMEMPSETVPDMTAGSETPDGMGPGFG